jgi:hypothetical protein
MTAHNPDKPPIEITPFDPYAITLPPLRWAKNLHITYIALLAPIVAVLLVVPTAAIGMLGGVSDIQPVRDIKVAIGRGSFNPATPFQYPLMRDIGDWIFAAIMIIEVMIMHQQWRLFADALPKLAKNGVLKLHSGEVPTPRGLDGSPPEQWLAQSVHLVNEHNSKRARPFTVLFTIIAVALAALLMLGERGRVFRVFTPKGLTVTAQRKWRLTAYQHWWASVNHPAGAVTYFLLVALAIYLVVVQTYVGLYAARIATDLPRYAQVDANWVNPDGYYGWGPVHKIFGTVWSSMALYGLLVSILAIILGLGGIGWIPAFIWLVLVTIYFAAPWFALRDIEATAIERHIDAAQAEAGPMTTKEQDELEARVKRYREARIRPMRLGHFQRVPVALSVLLPVVLNLAQPFIQALASK